MQKWFLAVLPPTDISDEIVVFQKEIEKRFGAIHAQRVVPHITIIPPFEAEKEKVESFMKKLSVRLSKELTSSVCIELSGFQKFESRTLFIDVSKNEAFERICRAIKLLFYEQKLTRYREEKHFFVPHITIANKDLRHQDFKIAWQEFRERKYQRSFLVNSITLLRHNGSTWDIYDQLSV